MTETVVTDPATLNKAAAMAAEETKKPVKARPKIEAPPEGVVTLPGGVLVFGVDDPVRTVEVRELNGFDEERLARIPRTAPGRLLAQILELGTVKIGEEPSTASDLEDLLVGDRDAILLGIRIATYGKDLELELVCPRCEDNVHALLDLNTDVPVKMLESQADRVFAVELKGGRVAKVGLPTGRDQKALVNAGSKNTAELNTMLLAGCVKSIDGLPVAGGTAVILNLGMSDREKLVVEIGKRAIGPQFGEVNLPCQSCSEDIQLALSLADLFRL